MKPRASGIGNPADSVSIRDAGQLLNAAGRVLVADGMHARRIWWPWELESATPDLFGNYGMDRWTAPADGSQAQLQPFATEGCEDFTWYMFLAGAGAGGVGYDMEWNVYTLPTFALNLTKQWITMHPGDSAIYNKMAGVVTATGASFVWTMKCPLVLTGGAGLPERRQMAPLQTFGAHFDFTKAYMALTLFIVGR